jgi:acetoin:2,6-dichlorophenolindophenol oxidoreductase subunit beta
MAVSEPLIRNRNVSQYIAEAIGLEMELDRRIVVLGEDVGVMGGVFGSTRGLQQRFGADRVRDTPIAEMTFTGMGVGLAMAGYKPLIEVMFVDFIGVCLEQVYNAVAKNHYMSGGTVPMPVTIKTAGGILGAAAQHSQCLWALFAHLPGMRVVVPSSPYDFKGLMASALSSPDPVIYIEHKSLLVRKAEDFHHGAEVPEERYTIPLGHAATIRHGHDVTIATLGFTVTSALEAADSLAEAGIEAEVIDLRTVVPLDSSHVAKSAARTGRLLVVDEDYLSFGLTGELITRVFEELGPGDAPVIARHAVPDVPIPAALTLEKAVIPSADSIASAVRELIERDRSGRGR